MIKIEHVVVIAMENRSFDHMLGYLDHPNPEFDGVLQGEHTNPGWENGPPVKASPAAKYVMPADPDHSHDSVMEQLALDANGQPQNTGFVAAYERKGRGLAVPGFGGLLGPVVAWNSRRKAKTDKPIENRGPVIMESQDPDNVPVLSKLALEFGVCTRWFCSVPGETWPNRNFMHAATSDGETNIDPRFYDNKTIFEQLEEVGKTWHIYYDDTPQVWAFHELWDSEKRRANWFANKYFAGHVRDGKLPAYSFIEPNHRPPFHLVDRDPTIDRGDASNNQHPGNNLVSNDAYDAYHTDEPVDFVRGEALLASIYEALRANPAVFEKTLLLITYDEHGGCYDHVPPPTNVAAPGTHASTWHIFDWIFHRTSKRFDFKMLGPRVPSIVISPFIEKHTVSTEVFDHSSIPATVRSLFAPNLPPLTQRDGAANTFDSLVTRTQARTDLPDLSPYTDPLNNIGTDDVDLNTLEQRDTTFMPEYYCDFVELSENVRKRMRRRGIDTVPVSRTMLPRLKAHRTTTAFRASAHRARA